MNADILKTIFTDVAKTSVEADGLVFNPNTITVAEIRGGQEYHGYRVKLRGVLRTARLIVQVDVGLGDSVIPKPEIADFPTLLNMPAPRLRVYPRETTIAEKLDAVMELGLKNTRMKDYCDICTLCGNFAYDGNLLCNAIRATLTRRGRKMPTELPAGLTDDFAGDEIKAKQWSAFVRTNRVVDIPNDFVSVVRIARNFLWPPLQSIISAIPFKSRWEISGPWRNSK